MPTAIVAALGLTGITATIVSAIISFAISSIFQSLLAPDEPDDQAEQQEQDGPLVNKRSNTSSIPVIYGTRRAGGNRIFVGSSGTDNNFLHVVLLVCEGEIDGFENIYIDDSQLRFSGGFSGGVLTEATSHSPVGAIERNELGNDENTDKFSGLTRIRVHNGGLNQSADSALTSEISQWTGDHRLRGRAYVYARFEYDQDTFGGIPNITCDVRGKIVKSVSGNAISDTLAYSNNPALCFRDYLINDDYGRGLLESSIDDDKIIEAATYCEEEITLLDSGGASISTGARYTCDGRLNTSASLYDNTKKILTTMRGFLVFSGGDYRLVLDKAETSEVLYDESNIIGSLNVDLGTKKNTLNKMRVTFWNPDKNGEDDTIIIDQPIIRNLLDNDVKLSREIQLPFCNSPHTARYLANQEIEQSRQQIHVSFGTGIAGLRNDIGDIIRIRHAQIGWGYRNVEIDGENQFVQNSPLTVGNIGQSELFDIWTSNTDYGTNAVVSEDGFLYKAIANPPLGDNPSGSAPCSGTTSGNWCQIDSFNQIPDLGSYGLLDLDNDGTNDTNVGVDGKILYKEFRILAIAMKENDEVDITAIEYDATVFDAQPLTLQDNTPNTSYQNPNRIGAPSNLVSVEDLYITTNSGGVKASLTFTWDAPNTPFVQAYDVSIHTPEQTYSIFRDYAIGEIVTFEGNRFGAIVANGPTTTLLAPAIGGNSSWNQLGALLDSDYEFLTRTRTRTATVLDANPGDYGVRIRSVSVTGVRSPTLQVENIAVAGLTAVPQNITGFSSTPQGDLMLLQWDQAIDLDVKIGGQIQVRHTQANAIDPNLQDQWASSSILTEGKSGVTTQIIVPLLTGVYLIKALDSSGIESALPGAILNTIEPTTNFNAVGSINEQEAWDGLIPANDHDDDNNSENVERVTIGGETFLRLDTAEETGIGDAPLTTTGVYYFSNLIEYSEVLSSRLSVLLDFTAGNVTALLDNTTLIDDITDWDGDVVNSDVNVDISTTEDDPSGTPTWTNYVPFTRGVFEFRAARFRLRLATDDLTTQIRVDACGVTFDAPDVTETANNLLWDGDASTGTTLRAENHAVAGSGDVGDSGNYMDVLFTLPFFNDVGTNIFSAPFLGISAEGLVPGQYFVLTTTPNGGTKAVNDPPFQYEGFRLQFKEVGTFAISPTTTVPLAPNSGTDSTISTDVTFDYQATGF